MFSRQIKKQLIIYILCIISIIFYSCEEPEEIIEIIFPPDGYSLTEGETVTLRSSYTEELPSWYLTDEYYGDGYSLTITPPCGDWELSCFTEKTVSQVQTLHVKEQQYSPGEERYFINTLSNSALIFAAGEYYPFSVNLNDKDSISTDLDLNNSRATDISNSPQILKDDLGIRDIRINCDINKLEPVQKTESISKGFVRSVYTTGMSIELLYPNPYDVYDVTIINAVMVGKNDNYVFWIDSNDSDNTEISNLIELFNNADIAEKTKLFWGESLDIDNDDSQFILLTSRINKTESILGFYNPLDCFEYNNDENSVEYNPCSNETDIIFAAVPDSNNESYSTAAVAATIAHEFHHLIHFQRKTLRRLWSGDLDAESEELFLDEGLSHLQESLCGLGESGGNLLFVRKWLSDTSVYSLGSYDLDGSTDSSGKRGAMAMFLWFIFQQQGGADWSGNIPIDNGGISFLNDIVEANETGWDVIIKLTGKSKQQLLKEFSSWINRMRFDASKRPDIIFDTVTGEAISISPYLGTFQYSNNDYIINGPNISTYNNKTAPEALSFYHNFNLTEKTSINIKQDEPGIQTLWGFSMIGE